MAEVARFISRDPVPDISLGNLTLNPGSYGVFIDGEPVELSVHEFEILSILAHQPDRILPYEELTKEVWQSSDRRQIRHLNVLVHRLRQKLAGSWPFVIQTVRGRGYGLVRNRNPAAKDDSNREARLMTI
jgi:two-component system response regulator VicR